MRCVRAVGMLLATALLAGCASTTGHPTPGGPSLETNELRFTAPTGWVLRESAGQSLGMGRVVVYLATQPLTADCGEEGSQPTCQSPIDGELRPGGVLVVWTAASCVAALCNLPAGSLISIGNRQGVRIPLEGGCEGTGFTERSAYYATVTPQRVDILIICARGPSDATRSAFLGFLDAIHWLIP